MRLTDFALQMLPIASGNGAYEGGEAAEALKEEVEDEDEPRLKYQRLGGSIPSLLTNDAASCVAVAERMIALGTHDGIVHILDFLGNQVKEFPSHTSVVNDLSFDIDGEYVASCSDDGCIVINSLFSDENMRFEYHRPMKAVAVDPEYARKVSKRFIAGGLAGNLYLNLKKWLGFRDQVLHSGEGPIHAIKWRASLVAWANDLGVKIYDAVSDQRVTFIEKSRSIPQSDVQQPHLVWQDDTLLVIAWVTSVKIVSIRRNGHAGTNGKYTHLPLSSLNQVDIVASFQTTYVISGIAPLGETLVVLAYIPASEYEEKHFDSLSPVQKGTAKRPEVHVVTWTNDELATDELPMLGFEHYKANDYSLAHAPFTGSSYPGGQWAASDEPVYYVVSPKDVVIAKLRDAEDHINWLLQHGRHEKALAAVETGSGKSELLNEVGSRYLDHLIVERRYAEAASMCPKLLRGSASAWERWVFHFAHLRQLPILVPYMPTENPRLRDTAYEVALVALATNPSFHKDLVSTVKSWSPKIYSTLPVISAIEPQIDSGTNELKEALAELYVINGQYEKGFSMYADLLNPEVFDFIEKHNLQDAIHEKVVQLMMLDCNRAVNLLVQQREIITPPEVVSQLLHAKYKCDSRYILHLYLHSLFDVSPSAGKDFHDMQVELYAEFDPKMLLPFLRSSQHYTLEKAYDICAKRDFVWEQVFIYGRMGNRKQAISIIINKLGDIEEAIEFVSVEQDDELWEELIKQCLNQPEMVGVLLEHTVGNLDPLHIVSMVPNGMEIPRLRDRLVKIITDYRTETSLRHGCNDIFKADCVNLLLKYYKEARHGVLLSNEEDKDRGKRETIRASQSLVQTMVMKTKTRGGGKCCMCFDPLPIQEAAIIMFFCCHPYHMTCLLESTTSISISISDNNNDEEDEQEEETSPSGPRLRCILCTTAAAGG
ncbi:unnamed protein product [Rhodiola kirilowii]